MAKRVLLATRELLLRSKLAAVVTGGGGEVVGTDAACDLAVLDIELGGATERIRGLVARGIPVLAYGSHVRADLLHIAREAGAVAVPNSAVEARLRELLVTP